MYAGWVFADHPYMFFSVHMSQKPDFTHPSLSMSFNQAYACLTAVIDH